jgi:hypothetical protein
MIGELHQGRSSNNDDDDDGELHQGDQATRHAKLLEVVLKVDLFHAQLGNGRQRSG